MKTHKHKAEVIEHYGYTAAVRFKSGRVECVCQEGPVHFDVGMKGWVQFTQVINGWVWKFTPFKKEEAKA